MAKFKVTVAYTLEESETYEVEAEDINEALDAAEDAFKEHIENTYRHGAYINFYEVDGEEYPA